MLEHGGRLRRAVREYGIPMEQWLDLSTGISPFAWPVPAIPSSAWHRLPEDDDELVEAACAYYETRHVLPVAGSQAAIQVLPLLRPASRVGIIAPGYGEHAQAWQRAGHHVTCRPADALLADVKAWDVLVLIHPNNPSGERFDVQQLLRIHAELAARGGWLVIDEAFIDVTPQDSLCRYADREGLVVLRSAGKFFGLAGARAGFVCAASSLLDAMREKLGPWTVSGPTRYVLRHALADHAWQMQARIRLSQASKQLAAMLAKHGLVPTGGCSLFQWCRYQDAARMHHALARRGVLTRLFDIPPSLRFGLPSGGLAFDRLDAALREAMQ